MTTLPFDPAAGDASANPGSRLAPLSVRQVNESADGILAEAIGAVWVRGEISRFVAHASGHWYFTLKDEEAAVSCAMFRGRNQQVRFRPEDGLAVLLLATPRVYVQQGRLQLIVEALEPAGQGAAALALEQLKQRLAAEGLFDAARKRPLPLLPRRLGVATSLDGAALRDVLKVLRRRFAGVAVLIAPTPVQGRDAPDEIVRALATLDRRGLDVLLLVRGGGAREDLAPFDDERVVRAISAARTPVVTGIGHEIDTTLADLAADLRAPTPSAAAELVVREREQLVARLGALKRGLVGALRHKIGESRQRLLRCSSARGFREPPRRIGRVRLQVAELLRRLEAGLLAQLRTLAERLQELERRLSPQTRLARLAGLRRRLDQATALSIAAARGRTAQSRQRLAEAAAVIQALSPLAVLARGYALVTLAGPEGPVVRDAGALAPRDVLHVRLARGAVQAEVTRPLPTPDDSSPSPRMKR